MDQFMGLRKINTIGLEQANKVMHLSAIAYNLKKYLKFDQKKVKSMASVLGLSTFLNNIFADLIGVRATRRKMALHSWAPKGKAPKKSLYRVGFPVIIGLCNGYHCCHFVVFLLNLYFYRFRLSSVGSFFHKVFNSNKVKVCILLKINNFPFNLTKSSNFFSIFHLWIYKNL